MKLWAFTLALLGGVLAHAAERPVRSVAEFGPFTPSVSNTSVIAENSATLNRALESVGQNGGGTVMLPAGVFHLAPSEAEITNGHGAAIHIRHDHVGLRGAGIGKTILRTRSEWSLVKNRVVRGTGIHIHGTSHAATPRRDIVLADFELDGGAGFTGHFGWPASTKNGDGWDITHKGIILSADDWVDDVTLESIYIHRYRGEVIYAGGMGLGKVRLRKIRSEDSNASTFNITADFVAEDCEFGHARFWAEIGTRFKNKSGTFRRCYFHDSHVTAIALCQGDGGAQPYLFEDCRFERTPGVFGLYGGVGGPVIIRSNIFTDAGCIISSGYAPNALTNINRGVLMENNEIVRGSAMANFYGRADGWLIRSNTFTGRDSKEPGKSTAVFYGAAHLSNCIVENNQLADCRTPEQTAPVKGERPLFRNNIYRNSESRDQQGTFTISAQKPKVTPHSEVITVYCSSPAAMLEIETAGYPDGQPLTVRGGRPGVPVKFGAAASSYTVKSDRLLAGQSELHFRFSSQAAKWVEE